MTNQIYIRQPTQRYEIYEIEKNKQYLVIDFHESMKIMKNGLPSNGSIHYVNSDEDRKKFISELCDKKRFETYLTFPATLDEIKDLYADLTQDISHMEFLCDSCTEIEHCPRFTEVQRYISLYDRERIFTDYSYYRGLAFHATKLNCREYKKGVIPRGRGFTIDVKRCEDCPWHKEEEVYDDNSEAYCSRAGTYIQRKRGRMGSEVNYIPNWCPMLPENISGKERK